MNAFESDSGSHAKKVLWDYGQEAMKPVLEVIEKYQGSLTPFIGSAEKALDGAISALSAEENNSSSDRALAGWLKGVKSTLTSNHKGLSEMKFSEMGERVKEVARTNPALAFAGSYGLGLLLGRGGRHVAADHSDPKSSSTMNEQTDQAQTSFQKNSSSEPTLQ